MPLNARRLMAVVGLSAACYLLFFFNLTGVGLLGPDEPRYAAIGREMARSGDWLTPRLWGEPWFEKPPLLYWMTAAAFRAGVGDDLAPRLPLAIAGVAFLCFYWRTLTREFGARAASFATAILATSAAWLAFSHVGVTDLPMAAAFAAAMLVFLRWIEHGERRSLTVAAVLLALAVLAKGLVPLVLALPVLWFGRARWRDLFRPAPVAAFFVIAAPWYAALSLRFGGSFLADLFWKHHVERFATGALQHVQPFWFYLPVLVAGLFPWSPLLVALFRRDSLKDRRRAFLLTWFVFGFLFFSAAENKLPGYLLPLIPALSALVGIRLAEMGRARWMLAACAALLAAVPVITAILPMSLRSGITRAVLPSLPYGAILAAFATAAFVWILDSRGRRAWAVGTIAAGMLGGVLWLEIGSFPVLDRTVSARAFWREIVPRAGRVCVGTVNRGWRYNLNYYSATPLPDCAGTARPLRVEQSGSVPPHLVETSLSVF